MKNIDDTIWRFFNRNDYSVIFCKILLLASICSYLYFNLYYLNSDMFDLHQFRQSQTALTAKSIFDDANLLNYQTPVIGEGWSIPFEFPIYQLIAATIAKLTGFNLISIGKVLSVTFGALSIFVAARILKLFSVKNEAIEFSASLAFVSPIYIYWSGSFMIETAALFFYVAFIYFWSKILLRQWSASNFIFAGLCLLLALLQKSTTALAAVPFFFFVFYFFSVRVSDVYNNKRLVFSSLLVYLIPLIIAYLWVLHTDILKMQNPIGQHLTSKALSGWNYGSIDQKLSLNFWYGIVYNRVVAQNSFMFFGLLTVFAFLLTHANLTLKKLVASSLFLFLLPFCVFTNLHAVHDYYQVSNIVFLSIAVGVAVYYSADRLFTKYAIVKYMVLSLFVGYSLFNYYGYYYKYRSQTDLSAEEIARKNRTIDVSNFIKKNTPKDMPIIVYGYDWSSEMAFYSDRKSLTLPWGGWDFEALANPKKFLPSQNASSIINCPNQNFAEINNKIHELYKNYIVKDVSDCRVYLLNDSKH